ncbi:hypothetical protein [Mycolicibacterium sp. XJ1819]
MNEPPDPFTTFAIAADTHCCAESPDNYLCTEEPGHHGWHRAEDGETGDLYDTWPGDA